MENPHPCAIGAVPRFGDNDDSAEDVPSEEDELRLLVGTRVGRSGTVPPQPSQCIRCFLFSAITLGLGAGVTMIAPSTRAITIITGEHSSSRTSTWTSTRIVSVASTSREINILSTLGARMPTTTFPSAKPEDIAMALTTAKIHQHQAIAVASTITITSTTATEGAKTPANAHLSTGASEFTMTLTTSVVKTSPCVIRPGTMLYDTKGRRVQAHGSGVYVEDGTYYLVGSSRKLPHKSLSDRHDGISEYINIYASETLCNWRFLGSVFNKSQIETHMPGMPAGGTVRMERPKLIRAGGKYVLWMHAQDTSQGSRSCAAVAVAPSVGGPYELAQVFYANDQISKDSTVFTDEDGSHYFVRDMAHLCVAFSPLTADGVGVQQVCSHTGPEDACRRKKIDWGASWLAEGVAVFRDPVDKRLFLVGSGLTGWQPNPGKLYVSNSTSLYTSNWQLLGNPMVGPGSESTFRAQTTFVLPYRPRSSNGTPLLIMLADRWNYPSPGLPEASYVWLPLQLSEAGNWTISWKDEWILPE